MLVTVDYNSVAFVLSIQGKHQFDWDSATCITYFTDYYQRPTLESWFTNFKQQTSSRFSSVLRGPSLAALSNLRKLLICAALMLISVVRLSGSSSMVSSSWSGITSAESSGSNNCSNSMVVESVDRLSGPGIPFLRNNYILYHERDTAALYPKQYRQLQLQLSFPFPIAPKIHIVLRRLKKYGQKIKKFK